MATLTIKNITKRFDKLEALKNVNLHIDDGRFCVLLGPSGCGKSTLLNVIAGLIPQDEGSIMMDGEPVDALSPRDRDVAMVFQNYALYPHMTVEKNLSFGLRMRKLPKDIIKTRVEETARLLGIEHLLNRKPRQLSGGQQQRVAMGRALVRRPKVFLLDEPLSNLDARLRASVRVELKQLHSNIRSTIVYVTHDQVEAMTLGDTVVVMQAGRILQIGSPEDIYDRPESIFVASFIGSPEMNIFNGSLVRDIEKNVFNGNAFALNLDHGFAGSQTGEVKLGVRPEDIEITTVEDCSAEVRVEMISYVGSEKYVHCRLGDDPLTIKAAKHVHFRTSEKIPIRFDQGKIHVFKDDLRL